MGDCGMRACTAQQAGMPHGSHPMPRSQQQRSQRQHSRAAHNLCSQCIGEGLDHMRRESASLFAIMSGELTVSARYASFVWRPA